MRSHEPAIHIGSTRGLFVARSISGRFEAHELGSLPSHPKGTATDSVERSLLRGAGIRETPQIVKGGIVADRENSHRLYVGTESAGIYRSDDDGHAWVSANKGLESLQIWSLTQHPITGDLYVGTEPAAIYRSRDHAQSWQPCGTFATLPRFNEWTFPRSPHVAHVKFIALDPEDPRLIVAAIEEGWLVRSRDGGANWENLTGGMEFDAHSVALVPGQRDVLLASSGNGFYRSDDGGEHFHRCMKRLDRSYLSPIVMHPFQATRIFLSAASHPPPRWFTPLGTDTAFYRSDDQGETWRRTGNTPAIRGGCWTGAMDPGDPDRLCFGLSDGSVWLTRDGGDHFDRILSDLGVVSIVAIHVIYDFFRVSVV